MESWGVEVKAGQIVKVKPEKHKLIHISQATLGELKNKEGPKNVPLRLRFPDGCKFLIGSLTEEKPQIHLDFVFENEFEFELSHGWKDGSVRFLGYITHDGEYSSDSSDTHSDVPVAASESGNESSEEEQDLPQMRIFVETLIGNVFAVKVRRLDSIKLVKEKIEEVEGIPVKQQRLLFCGRQMEDENTLAKYNIMRDSRILLVLRLCGC